MTTDKPNKTTKTRISAFPCPVCGSDKTIVFVPTVQAHNKDQKENSADKAVILGANVMPNYIRDMRCPDCESKWKTIESVIMDSVYNKKNECVG